MHATQIVGLQIYSLQPILNHSVQFLRPMEKSQIVETFNKEIWRNLPDFPSNSMPQINL